MSPREALQSPVVHFYLALVLSLLLIAGLVLGLVRKRMHHAWQAYRGWLFIVPITTVAILLGRESTILFFTAVGLLGFKEFARATGLSGDQYLTGGVYLGIAATGVVALVPDPTKEVLGWYDLFM